ncbi:MAG: response regulator transcription factor [bacterium]|nr:response regulator transcription factor [bacterium]
MASRIIVIADEAWARNEVHSALTEPDFELIDHSDPTTAQELLESADPDAVVIDLQVASMGGMAIARELHQQAALNDTTAVPVVLLLDRAADSFLAKRSGVAGWVVKPFTAHDLRTAIDNAIAK